MNDERGQDLAEYALLIGLLAVVVFVAVMVLGDSLLELFGWLEAQVASWM